MATTVRPFYPAVALERGQSARVVVRFTLRPDGRVGEIRVCENNGGIEFDLAAKRWAWSQRYEDRVAAGAPENAMYYEAVVEFDAALEANLRGDRERRVPATAETRTTATSTDSPTSTGRDICGNYRDVLQAMPYPREALRLGIEGRVVVRFQLNADGVPVAVYVHESSGTPDMERAATEGVWRFRCQGQGRRITGQIPFDFRLRRIAPLRPDPEDSKRGTTQGVPANEPILN